MMKKTILLIAGILSMYLATGQEKTLTLKECLEMAEMNNPVKDQTGYFASSSELKIKNLNKNYLPDMYINGEAHYQSDVTQVPTVFEQFAPEPLSKDQYKVSLDVSQMIYDGGVTRRSKSVEELDNQIDQQGVEIDLYQMKDRVTNIYFNIIILQENKALLLLQQETLEAQLKDVRSGVNNGILLASNADILEAELLKLGQRIDESDIAIASGFNVLSILVGKEIHLDTKLDRTTPAIDFYLNGQARLEYGLFSLQQQKMESMKQLSSSKLIPKFMAYGQAAYGRPALDMLKNEFNDSYIIGAKMSWNFWNWNRTRNEKSILDMNSNIIASNRDVFSQNLSIDLVRKQFEISRYQKLIEKDQQIADLRSNIMKTYSSQLKNGIITSTEYITELRAETEAMLNLKIDQVQLLRSQYEYLAAAGKL